MRRVFLYLLSSSTALFCTSKFLSRLTYPRGDRSCKYSMLLTSSLLLYRAKCTITDLIWFYIINFPIRNLLMVVPFKNGQRKKESNFARLEKKPTAHLVFCYTTSSSSFSSKKIVSIVNKVLNRIVVALFG